MEQLLTHVESGIGWITINRPEALNALNANMFRSLSEILDVWEDDSSVKFIVIQGAGEKAFSAGGDVRAATDSLKAGRAEAIEAFFRKEYRLNAHIYHYSKPYVSLIDGIAMGGGLGVSVNGSHRIVTERALLAMPETTIGFFPDVGASTFLNKAPGAVGLYLGLTGTTIKASDALWAGLGTHFIPSSILPQFKKDLIENVSLTEALDKYTQIPEEKGFLEHHLDQIDKHFNKPSLMDILDSLKGDSTPFAQNTYNTLLSKSPMSLAVTFRLLKYEAPPLSFDERLKLDFRLTLNFHRGHDFIEGVRALLIDKDKMPRWKPAKVEDIKESDVEAYFAILGERELNL